jgi:peptide/nickel transport system substrate-binding protein
MSRPTILAIAIAVVTAAGCTTNGGAPDAGASRAGHGGTVVVSGLIADPANGFNPKNPKSNNLSVGGMMASQWRGVWRVTPDSRFELNKDLVESAELVSTDPQSVVYKINPEAVWSDGVAVTADDFIYNWQVAQPGATDIDGSPLQGPFSPSPIGSVVGSDGGKTVTVVFKEHYAPWKSGFMPFNSLVPAHVARRVGWNSGFDRFDPAVLVSNGPFRIESYNPGRDLTLGRNDRYWAAPPNLDRIVFRFTSEAEWIPGFRNGELDLLHVLDPTDDLLAQVKDLGATHEITPGLNQEYVGFNLRNDLLAIPEVRKAIALSLDRHAITERTVGRDASVTVVNNHLFANNQPGYRDNSGGRYERPDVVGAKRLLEGAGFAPGADGVYARDGKRLSFRLRAPSEGGQVEVQLIQAHARRAGIELRLDTAPFNVLTQQLARGDFDVEVINYGKNMWGMVSIYRPGNRFGYTNQRPNELIQRSASELDEAKRASLLNEADAILWDDMPVLPLYQRPLLAVWRAGLINIEPNVNVGAIFWNVEAWARKG